MSSVNAQDNRQTERKKQESKPKESLSDIVFPFPNASNKTRKQNITEKTVKTRQQECRPPHLQLFHLIVVVRHP